LKYVVSLKVRNARRRLERELTEFRDAGAMPNAVVHAIDEFIYAHIAPLIEQTVRGALRGAKRKDPRRAVK
jgi:hypothetical protein